MKVKFSLIRKILLAIGAIFLIAMIIFITRDTTVDFSGTITLISKSENGEITYVISAINGELTIIADGKTKYTLYSKEKINADDVSVGDIITGDYRRFNKARAKIIRVAPHHVEPTWNGGEAEINNIKASIIQDVKAYYTALYSMNEALPEFTLPMKDICKTFIEKRYNYDVQIPKSVGIAEITDVSATVTEHTIVGYYLIFDVEMNLSFNYAEINESGKVNRKMQIAVDMNNEAITADWHETYSRYEMDVRGVTDLTDTSCLLENNDISYEEAPIELEWTDDYLPLNIDPPSIKGRKFTYTNPDVSGRDLMGFQALIYYDNESGEYVNKIEGWGNDCVEKAEFTSEYIKIYFAENTILDELMYKIGGDIRINSYAQKRLTDNGQPTNYIVSKKDFYYEASESYFTKENGRDILTLKFDEPITEPISSIDIEWGKID